VKFKNKKLPYYIVGLSAVVLMGAAYSARAMLEIGPIATITADRPQLRFIDTNGGEDWIIDAATPAEGNRLVLGVMDEVQPSGTGSLIIDAQANDEALVVRRGGIVVNGLGFDPFFSLTDELIVRSRFTGGNVNILLMPDQFSGDLGEIEFGERLTSFVDNNGVTDFGFSKGFAINMRPEDFQGDVFENGFHTPFGIDINAPTGAFGVDAQGNVGIGAVDPDTGIEELLGRLHIKGDNIYFDSRGPRWDWLMSADDDVFSITSIDVPRGISTVPFEVQTGAPDESLVVDDDGNVGIGTDWADSALHVFREDGTASLKVEDASPTPANRALLELTNNGGVRMALDNLDANQRWEFFNNRIGDFNITRSGTGGSEFAVTRGGGLLAGPGGTPALDLRPTGNLFIAGTLFESSDRDKKENFEEVDCEEVLNQVIDMPITTWNYKTDEDQVRHIGPMAQDFKKAFDLGDSDKTIAMTDKAGISLAAIKALNAKLNDKDEQIEALNMRLEKLEALLSESLK